MPHCRRISPDRAGKREYLRLMLCRHIHQGRDIIHISLGHSCPNRHGDACPAEHGDNSQRFIMGTGAADFIVGFPQAVQRKSKRFASLLLSKE